MEKYEDKDDYRKAIKNHFRRPPSEVAIENEQRKQDRFAHNKKFKGSLKRNK